MPLAIDEIPLVALLGLFADGETVVHDAAELRAKESDRLAVVAEGLCEPGRRHRQHRRRLADSAARGCAGGRVDSHGDHRMAMLFALAGALGDGVEIAGADSVAHLVSRASGPISQR